MPNNPSAAKRLRQNEKARVRNKMRKTELKTIAKKIQRAIGEGNREDAESLYRRYAKRVDQAAAHNVMHRNAASRRKSRMAIKLNGLAEPSA